MKGPFGTQRPCPTLSAADGEPSDPKPVVGEKMEELEREKWSRDQSQYLFPSQISKYFKMRKGRGWRMRREDKY